MMGEQIGAQGRFFYDFNLEEQIPQDHLLRQIDGVLDLNHLRRQLAPHYSHTGRPSIDPELMENTGKYWDRHENLKVFQSIRASTNQS